MLNENVVRKISERLEEPKWLLDRRLDALKTFQTATMPSFKYGIGIFVDISALDIDKINPLEKSDAVITGDKNIEILSFQEAMQKHESIIKEFFMTKCIQPHENKLTALHAAFFTNGILIRIPENVKAEKPISITLDLNTKTHIEHILVVAEKNSKAEMKEVTTGDEKSFRSHMAEVIVKENAHLEYKTVQNVGRNVYNFSKKKALIEQGGLIHWIDCHLGSKFTQTITTTKLQGENAKSKSWSIIFGDQEQCFDVFGETTHLSSKTQSDMKTRVVLNDKAKGVYRGLVRINKKAVDCRGYQKEDTILLSEDAEANAVPYLEIENNEVQCSHGATISQIDEDKLFYMMSRGLDEIEAKRSIVEGFFDPLLAKLEDEQLSSKMKQVIVQRLQQVQ